MHAPIMQVGIKWVTPLVFLFDSLFEDKNPLIHTPSNTSKAAGLSWSHTIEYTNIVVAFVYKLGI
ncbi:hypothetical protein BDZ94DRAFT_1268552 [Collybia nuda]|uniref:Uncharacterized protein n=1 Tax=Collybia nuda TaxID=64659 RepID=A0A9P5XZ07_9AGAR|nr:hypothetical protein BDZ94DRAFT_1268552 [Collybia nuda]